LENKRDSKLDQKTATDGHPGGEWFSSIQNFEFGKTVILKKPNQCEVMQKTALCNPNAVVVPLMRVTFSQPLKKLPQSFRFTTKTLLIMKLTILFLALGLLNARAEGFSQTVTFSGKNVKLTKAFEAIEAQTGYSIFANKGLLKEVKPVSVSVKDMPLNDFLDIIFKNQPIGYEIDNKTIFIKEKPTLSTAVTSSNQPPAAQKNPLALITGIVTSSDGTPLEGATVIIKGTKNSVVTDASGRFSINAEAGQTLLITYIGYTALEEPINGRTTINVTLQKLVNEIEQVVVTALGITKKAKALTYNVQEVKGDEVNRVKDANFVNSLAGKVAGVTINSASSGIGGSTRVVMRGEKSLFGNNNALYVVDGIPLPNISSTQPNDVFQGAGQTGDGISNINPEDIASISILTGPAAAALYGYQAASGVVLITTKKGTAGKLNLSVTNSTNFFSPLILPEFQNTYGSDPGDYSSWGPKLKTPSTYDPKDFFQTGTNITNAISLSTGTDKNQTYFSAASVNAKGIIPNNKLTRYNFSVRNTSSFLDDKLNLDLSIMYTDTKEQNMFSQGQYFNPLVPVYLFPRGDDINRYIAFERYNPTRNFNTQFWPFGDLGFQAQNPHWIINRDFFINNKNRYVLSSALKYNLNNWINISSRVKLDNNTSIGEKKYSASTSGLFASPAGAYYKNTAITRQVYADALISINKSFLRNKYNLNVNAGASILDAQYNLDGYGGNLLSVPNLFSFSNVNSALATATQEGYHDQVQSVFANAQVSYQNMLFLEFTGRSDWASQLAHTTTKSFFYPSVGASGILTDLLHIQSRIFSFIKARASYSEVGNPPSRFASITTYPIVGGFPVTSSYLAATILEPERTKSFEAGLNVRLFKNKINLDVTAYESNTYNQLFNPVLAPSTGYSSFYVNAGQVNNKGIEASLGVNMKIGKVGWNALATFSLNRNKIIKLLTNFTDHTTGQTVSVDSLSVGGTGSYMMALVKGGSVGDIYVTSLATDEHGYIDVGLVSQTVTAAPNTYIKAGNANPKYNIGLRNSFSYKNFNLDFLVSARIGGVCVSVTQAIMDRFGVSKTSAEARDAGGVVINGQIIPAEPYYEVVGGGVAGVGSMYVYSATNVRLGEASFGYTFPAKFFRNKIQGLTLTATGRNLFMIYSKAPFDPETTANTGTYYQGIDYFMQPSLRSVGFSVKVQF
jgi:TonB-linked SusC/RagA family outer membrane protein